MLYLEMLENINGFVYGKLPKRYIFAILINNNANQMLTIQVFGARALQFGSWHSHHLYSCRSPLHFLSFTHAFIGA
jgi:hypothetical protein